MFSLKFIVENYKDLKINNLSFNLMKPEKEQIKPKVDRRTEIIKIRYHTRQTLYVQAHTHLWRTVTTTTTGQAGPRHTGEYTPFKGRVIRDHVMD